MRGRQVKVYLHPEDHAMVDDFVHNQLGCVLLAENSRSRTPQELPRSYAGDDLGALICRPDTVSELSTMHIPRTGMWWCESTENPVIEWSYSKLDGDTLYPGRFFFVPEALVDDAYKEKDPAFVESGDRLVKWVRRTIPLTATEWGRERLGPVAAEMLAKGALKLRQNPPGSLF